MQRYEKTAMYSLFFHELSVFFTFPYKSEENHFVLYFNPNHHPRNTLSVNKIQKALRLHGKSIAFPPQSQRFRPAISTLLYRNLNENDFVLYDSQYNPGFLFLK